jgi:hypothetical protein
VRPREIASVVDRVAELVVERYVFADVGVSIASALRQQLAAGEFDDARSSEQLSELVTPSLQSVNGDRHLRLLHNTEIVFDDTGDDPFEAAAALAAAHGGGVAEVRRLAGGVAYVRLEPILFPPAVAGEQLSAAMSLVADAAALVIDVRECLGGDPAAVAFICSYLFGVEPVHLTDLEERHGVRSEITQYWTLPYVPGRRFGPTKPIFVLTSKTTFSGAEDLCFALKELGRAVVVGETTGGGAHPREGFRVHSDLEVTIPVARALSPRSGRNWEGIGVTPDFDVEASRALTVALEQAGLAPDGD